MDMILTFDVFSALIDSRSGGSAFLHSVSEEHGWPTVGSDIYDLWDSTNKQSHRTVDNWVPFAELSALAMKRALASVGLPTDAANAISSGLLESMTEWPLWPDVSAHALLRPGARLGLLSNIDDALLAETAVVRLGIFESELIVTSERARAYKPSPVLYRRAMEFLGPFLHVASSARDVRGAVSAGIPCVRLQRPGHSLDATGPAPRWTVTSTTELVDAVTSVKESGTFTP